MHPAHGVVRAALNVLLLLVTVLLAPAAVSIDLMLIGDGVPESSVTEYSQEFLLLLTAAGFFVLG